MGVFRSRLSSDYGKNRLVSRLTIFSLCSCLIISVEDAAASIKRSDAELSQQLIGTWEYRRKYTPVEHAFVRFDQQGNYKAITILKIKGREGREELEGKWRVSDGRVGSRFHENAGRPPMERSIG